MEGTNCVVWKEFITELELTYCVAWKELMWFGRNLLCGLEGTYCVVWEELIVWFGRNLLCDLQMGGSNCLLWREFTVS
jgi:hypothetical protein